MTTAIHASHLQNIIHSEQVPNEEVKALKENESEGQARSRTDIKALHDGFRMIDNATRFAESSDDLTGVYDALSGFEGRMNNFSAPQFSQSGSQAYRAAMANESVLGSGIVTMAAVMALLQEKANDLYSSMSDKTTIAREAQEMANILKAQLAKVANNPDARIDINHDVYAYFAENDIYINGKSPSEWVNENTESGDSGRYGISQDAIKAMELKLESVAGQASDFVQQTQLKLQQSLQNYNTAVTMTQSLQSMLAESTKSIAGAIR